MSGGYRFQAIVPRAAVSEPQSLVGAKVRLRGTAATSFNAQLRQLITIMMFVPFPSDFIVEKTVSGDPFELPVLPLNSLGQYRRGRELNERVHVKGTVTYQRRGEDLFLQDALVSHLFPGRWPDTISAVDLVTLARGGDAVALRVVERSATWLGRGIAQLVDLLDPEVVILGALGWRAADLYLPTVVSVVGREACPREPGVRIEPAQLGERLGDVAALAAAIHHGGLRRATLGGV